MCNTIFIVIKTRSQLPAIPRILSYIILSLVYSTRRKMHHSETRTNVRPNANEVVRTYRYAAVYHRRLYTFLIWQTETIGAVDVRIYTRARLIHVFARTLIKLCVSDGYLFIFSMYERQLLKERLQSPSDVTGLLSAESSALHSRFVVHRAPNAFRQIYVCTRVKMDNKKIFHFVKNRTNVFRCLRNKWNAKNLVFS